MSIRSKFMTPPMASSQPPCSSLSASTGERGRVRCRTLIGSLAANVSFAQQMKRPPACETSNNELTTAFPSASLSSAQGGAAMSLARGRGRGWQGRVRALGNKTDHVLWAKLSCPVPLSWGRGRRVRAELLLLPERDSVRCRSINSQPSTLN
jgi:hypothetical protein